MIVYSTLLSEKKEDETAGESVIIMNEKKE